MDLERRLSKLIVSRKTINNNSTKNFLKSKEGHEFLKKVQENHKVVVLLSQNETKCTLENLKQSNENEIKRLVESKPKVGW